MKWLLIVYLFLPDNTATFIVPEYTFQSQSACVMALEDIKANLTEYRIYAECVRFPEERDG